MWLGVSVLLRTIVRRCGNAIAISSAASEAEVPEQSRDVRFGNRVAIVLIRSCAFSLLTRMNKDDIANLEASRHSMETADACKELPMQRVMSSGGNNISSKQWSKRELLSPRSAEFGGAEFMYPLGCSG